MAAAKQGEKQPNVSTFAGWLCVVGRPSGTIRLWIMSPLNRFVVREKGLTNEVYTFFYFIYTHK